LERKDPLVFLGEEDDTGFDIFAIQGQRLQYLTEIQDFENHGDKRMSFAHYLVRNALEDSPNRRWIDIMITLSSHRVWVDSYCVVSSTKSDIIIREPPIVYVFHTSKIMD
jgi:hypothetical protein